MPPWRNDKQDDQSIYAITRPHSHLLIQYFLWSLASTVLFPFVFIPLLIRYKTLVYRFDSEGVSVSWGLFWRREINLTYARIQDIHVTRGIVERWLGLASLAIQTASGSAAAEVTIQGVKEYDALRDFLYRQMRGRRFMEEEETGAEETGPTELLNLLQSIHQDLAALRKDLSREAGPREEQRESGATEESPREVGPEKEGDA